MGADEVSRATKQARQAAERVGRDVRVIGRQESIDPIRDIPILVQAVSDLAESVVVLAFVMEAIDKGV